MQLECCLNYFKRGGFGIKVHLKDFSIVFGCHADVAEKVILFFVAGYTHYRTGRDLI